MRLLKRCSKLQEWENPPAGTDYLAAYKSDRLREAIHLFRNIMSVGTSKTLDLWRLESTSEEQWLIADFGSGYRYQVGVSGLISEMRIACKRAIEG